MFVFSSVLMLKLTSAFFENMELFWGLYVVYSGYVMSTLKYSVIPDEFMLPSVSLQEKVTLWLPSPTVVRLFQLPEVLVMVMFGAASKE